MNDMMRRVSPEKFAAKFTANNVNFLNIALSTLQNAGSTLSNEHL
jgi:hypothetical protein